MVGIYRILNLVTNQSYIGQSTNIAQRINEHYYHRTATKASLIDQAINQYGISNFMFQILEICKFEELDWKEDYYIRLFQTNIYGYNVVAGGQHNIGESNSNVKLTYQDVYNIREAYNNHANPNEVYNQYKNRVSISYFFNLWRGATWTNVHMDVYTDENKEYYKNLLNESSYKSSYNSVKFTDEEVMYFRKRYVNETAEQIYNSISTECKFNTFKCLLTGQSYKHLPIYDKKNKMWVNNTLEWINN